MFRRTFLRTVVASAALYASSLEVAFAGRRRKGALVKNPLLAPFTGPHGGMPPFDKITPTAFEPAFREAMDLHRTEIAAIVANTAPATFDNTILALEDSGRPLQQVTRLVEIYISTMNDKTMQEIETRMAPVLAAYADEVIQNEALFTRVKAVWDGRASAGLDAEKQRLLEIVYRRFARRGAALGKADKARLAAINRELASLYTTFGQNQLADEEEQMVVLDAEADLAGLPDGLIAAARAAAEARGLAGKWVISNTRSSVDPFLTYATRRDLREKVWKMFVSRGDHRGAHDNRPVITQILALRSERAGLLGFKSHAHWMVDDNMARTPEAAMDLMMKVWKATAARVREEVADMQKVADADKAGLTIAPWDYRFYAEKVRKDKYDLDQNQVKAYLQLDRMRDAMFWAAGQLFGLRFTPVRGVPVYHPDVRVYEVTRGKKRIGLFYLDPYARAGKRSGAWMSEYRTQESFKGPVTPIVSNNSNFVKGKAGEPVLISWDDAQTLFHEFGHALHGLLSSTRYPTLAGANTLLDFVEFPSQLNERWLATPEVLQKFAVHYQTGEPIPAELVAKIQKARTFNQGFTTAEYLMSAIYDMKIHMASVKKPIDPVVFETRVRKEIGAPAEIALRHRPTQFGHVFSGDGYSAGYYSYMWADTLTADAAEAFVEAGSFYDKATARRLEETIFRVGNSVAPDQTFHAFRGRDVDTNALMRDRGFPVTR